MSICGPRIIGAEVDVHEGADGEQHEAEGEQPARVEMAHQQRHEGDDDELRQADPQHHHAGLARAVAMRHGEIERDEIDGAIQHEAEQETAHVDEGEIPLREQPQIDQRRLVAGTERLNQEQRQGDRRDDREMHDEGRAEPVVLIALLQHHLQRAEPDRHGDDAEPVAGPELAQMHRRRGKALDQCREHERARHQVEEEDIAPAIDVGDGSRRWWGRSPGQRWR